MSKRERGEGSISQRKDGIWTGRVYLGRSLDGKQKVKAVYGKTEKEVKRRIKEVKEELMKNDSIFFSRLLFSELLINWIHSVKKYELWNCQEMCSQKIPKILDKQESGGVMS